MYFFNMITQKLLEPCAIVACVLVVVLLFINLLNMEQ